MLVADTSARSSVSSYGRNAGGLELFHQRWFGPSVPWLPLCPEKVCGDVQAWSLSLFDTYMDHVKDLHIEPGDPWTDALVKVSRRARR